MKKNGNRDMKPQMSPAAQFLTAAAGGHYVVSGKGTDDGIHN